MPNAAGDAYGRLILDAIDGKKPIEVVERDDGFVFAYHSDYLIEPFRRWQPVERRAQRFVRGRVLDIGCGAGRVCLHLQVRGLDAVGIDNSPGAVEGCRRRGVKDVRLCAIDEVDERLGSFDTLVMLGNNFGLIGDKASGRRALRAMHAVTRRAVG
jgi:SAM-dependent methyltransferase